VSDNVSEWFERVADKGPDRVAIIAANRRLTYAQLDERANRLAHHLAGMGVKRGDHIGLQLQNGTEYIEAMLAAFKLRAVPESAPVPESHDCPVAVGHALPRRRVSGHLSRAHYP
jgi:acyl-CoA synthetase (AMP-forming)/AMP-acid ligase II